VGSKCLTFTTRRLPSGPLHKSWFTDILV
jgi:hypothetical protein